MFKHISQQRLIIYLIVIGFLPILLATAHLVSRGHDLEDLEALLFSVQELALVKEQKQSQNMAVRQHYRDADHFYIDKHVESLAFLEPEIESLQKILNQSTLAEDENVKKRLDFLIHGNTLEFSEGVVQSCSIFQEVVETQLHSVEINSEDLQKILSRIEGIEIGSYLPGPCRPQLMVIDFKLDRKKITDKNEVFLLSTKLLKREFL